MFVRRTETRSAILENTMFGDRRLAWAGYPVFCERLEQRISATLDPSGTTRQRQSVVQVGCSTNLDRRMNDHDPLAGLGNSSKAWALLCSCLKKLKIRFEPVIVPIVKVWKPDQLRLAEIMVTMLASSMMWDGGLNEVQAGGRAARADPDKFGEALKQIFIIKPWATANLQSSHQELQRRGEALSVYQQIDEQPEEIGSTIEKSIVEMAAIQKQIKQTSSKLQRAQETSDKTRAETKTTLSEMRAAATNQIGWERLHQRLLNWEKGQDDEGGGEETALQTSDNKGSDRSLTLSGDQLAAK